MTKKSKKKAVKTGYRSAESPRVTTFALVSNIAPQDKYGISNLPMQMEQMLNIQSSKTILTKGEKRRIKEQKQRELFEAYQHENSKRCIYPIDLWFLLSQYILPEQVGVFAAICKSAHYVCSTKKFWMDLYKRYVTEYKSLPSHLKPKAITTNVGVRARVIRAIYHVYKPLAQSIIHDTPIADTTTQVEYKICEMHWWRQLTLSKRNIKVWLFYFKLTSPEQQSHQANVFKLKDLVGYNPDNYSSILQVVLPSFIHVLVNLAGLCLTSAGVSVSRDMRHHRLKLAFHEYRTMGKYISSQAKVIVMEPVLEVKVLNWWHPEYPHPFDH